MSDLHELMLSEIGEIITGSTPSTAIAEFWNGEVPFYSPADFQDKVFSRPTERNVTILGANTGRNISVGSIMVTCIGSIGKMAICRKNGITNQQINTIVLKPNFDSKYIYYLILNGVNKFVNFAPQTTIPILNKTEFGKFKFLFHPYNQQQKIANILSTVDNLIEKTQSLIDKYTSIKQGMMADLFTRGIDLSGTPDTNKNYGQLRPSVTESPELYQETDLGWIPKNWKIVDLEAIATVDRGKFTHRPRDDAKCYGGIHPFIQTGSVTKAKGGFITEYRQTLSNFGRNVSREFQAGTIAVTIAANIADTGILNIPMCFPDSIVGVIVNESLATIRYVEVSIRRNKQRLDALAPLSAQKNINLEDLRPLKIALPPLVEQIELCRRYESNEKLIHKEVEYLEKLKLQKKGLMQDLLTGIVKV